METLQELDSQDKVSLYSLEARHEHLHLFIASSEETRQICTQPEIIGTSFTQYLKKGLDRIITQTSLLKDFLQPASDWACSKLRI